MVHFPLSAISLAPLFGCSVILASKILIDDIIRSLLASEQDQFEGLVLEVLAIELARTLKCKSYSV